MQPFHYFIDVVGGCNLRCPSCPVGNSPEADHSKGLMDVQLFKDGTAPVGGLLNEFFNRNFYNFENREPAYRIIYELNF